MRFPYFRTTVLGLLLLAGGAAFAFPTGAQAATTLEQCRQNPKLADCLSFDPAVNPLLSGYTVNKNSPGTIAKPQQGVPDQGTCVLYNPPAIGGFLPTASVSGCVNPADGEFHIYDDSVAATAGGESLTALKADTTSNGTAIAPIASGQGCDAMNPLACLQDAGMWVVKQIAIICLFIAALIAGLAGYVFNQIVYITIFQFGNLIGNNPGMLAAWGVLRDVGNIILLFGFIFMGVSTILNLPHNEFTAKKALPALIIFAILMNFSLFAAEAVIDTSNALATTIYRQAKVDTCDQSADYKECATNQGIAGSVFRVSGISTIFSIDQSNLDAYFGGASSLQQILELLFLTLFALVAAFVFIAAVVMFIIRTVMLAFLMATSPIGFAGMAVPPLHELASGWWKQLINQSFFAPVYILLILISIKFMEGVSSALAVAGSGTPVTLASALGGSGTSNVSMIIVFLLVMGFMFASVVLAKQFGAAGADRATSLAGGLAFGTVGFIGRRTIGAGATATLQSDTFRRFAQNNVGLARLAQKPLKNMSESSYSARGAIAGLVKKTHVEVGKPNKAAAHGFHGIEEKEKKAIEEFEKSINPTSDQRGVATELEKELEDKRRAFEARRAKELEEVHAQRMKVERARLAGDQKALDVERGILAEKIKAYEDRANDEEGKALKKEIDSLNRRAGAWRNYADKEKREAVIESLHSQTNWWGPGSPESHAAHEAADSIRKNAGKSKLEKALKDVQDAAEKKADGDEAEHDAGEHEAGAGSHAPAGGHGPTLH